MGMPFKLMLTSGSRWANGLMVQFTTDSLGGAAARQEARELGAFIYDNCSFQVTEGLLEGYILAIVGDIGPEGNRVEAKDELIHMIERDIR